MAWASPAGFHVDGQRRLWATSGCRVRQVAKAGCGGIRRIVRNHQRALQIAHIGPRSQSSLEPAESHQRVPLVGTAEEPAMT